jgi:hypothetical protein
LLSGLGPFFASMSLPSSSFQVRVENTNATLRVR